MKTTVKISVTYFAHGKAVTHERQQKSDYDEKGNAQYKDEYKGIREVTISTATQFALKTFYTKDGSYRDSFMPWPKRDEVVFNADGSFTIRELNDRNNEWVNVITYAFQPETASQVEFYGSRDHLASLSHSERLTLTNSDR